MGETSQKFIFSLIRIDTKSVSLKQKSRFLTSSARLTIVILSERIQNPYIFSSSFFRKYDRPESPKVV